MANKANNSPAEDRAPEPSFRPLSDTRRSHPRWRARPDGHQHWVRLPVDPSSAARLRVRAAESGLTVDAWLGIATAYAIVKRETAEIDLSAELRQAVESEPLRFAPNERLRSWQRYLLSADGPGHRDELPEAVLGAGISSRAATDALPMALDIGDTEWELARECELRAAAKPTPLEIYIRGLVATRG